MSMRIQLYGHAERFQRNAKQFRKYIYCIHRHTLEIYERIEIEIECRACDVSGG